MTPAEYAATEARLNISEVEPLKGAISIAAPKPIKSLSLIHI